MKNKNYNQFFIILLITAFFFACNDATDIGLGLIPDNELINLSTNDTIEIEAFTYNVDSVVTSAGIYAFIGSYIDPIFGSVQSSFVTQTQIGLATSFGTTPIVDSVKLFLRYKSDEPIYYGNNINTHSLLVYEISNNLTNDTIYYSNFDQNLITKKYEIANTSYSYASKDNDSILAISIDNDYGERIISSSTTWTDTTFNDYFRGIWIKSADTPEDAAISIFDISSTDTKLTIFYHNTTDTTSYDFIIGTSCFRTNLFSVNHSSGNLLTDLNNPESQQDTVIYIQGFNGLKSKILTPGLDELKEKGNWAVNRAELVFTAADESYTYESLYPAPAKISIFGINDEGLMTYLDEFYTSDTYSGVTYSDNKYRVDLSHSIQQILSGEKENNGFYIMVNNANENPSRIVIGGPDNSNRIKLILTLTKI
ncbi:MAG: DUF4270 family protein [Bacteroidales bacterium]|nr:DUF4270 family protein [Bacteroidales bacterium]MBN2757907.1 DUF4270 family protein [Bacteroidales bacterium]